MKYFKKFFGVEEREIKPDCIICPMDSMQLFYGPGDAEARPAKGIIFSVLNTQSASIITSKIGSLTGDCVLMLKDTQCENLYLFGSCGSAGVLDIGTKVIVKRATALESFTEMLKFKDCAEACFPDKKLFERLSLFASGKNLMQANCATVGSLLLEPSYLQWFAKHKISCVDMEASLVFSAAGHIKRKAAALMYVTDIIMRKPFYGELEPAERERIGSAKKELASLLLTFIQNARP